MFLWFIISFEDSLSYDAEGNELCISDILCSEKDDVTSPVEDFTYKMALGCCIEGALVVIS